jgi:lysophospholipase L1-like esterase
LKSLSRRGLAVATLFAMSSILSLSGLISVTSASASGAATPTTAFYLDIGGSASIGVQPDSSRTADQRTNRGYANDLVSLEAGKGITLDLDEIGCSGETTTTMLSGGDKCYLAPDSQLAEAIEFLSAHRDQTGLVTIDLGFNDIISCVHDMSIDPTCLSQQMLLVNEQLPEILSDLKAAAGPDTYFVGVGHYDPYLADALRGRDGLEFANDSSVMIHSLNSSMASIYQTFSIPMADVAKQFTIDGRSKVTLPGFGSVRGNIARTCELTWMCPAPGKRPNIHPDDAGYRAIAEAINAVLPAQFDLARGAEPLPS